MNNFLKMILLDILLTFGISYGTFLTAYEYSLIQYRKNPPEKINNRLVDKDHWEYSMHRYPFYASSGTILENSFAVSPIKSNSPCVRTNSIMVQNVASFGVSNLDAIFIAFSLISAARTSFAYWTLMAVYLIISAAAGYSFGLKDFVCDYVLGKIEKKF